MAHGADGVADILCVDPRAFIDSATRVTESSSVDRKRRFVNRACWRIRADLDINETINYLLKLGVRLQK